MDIIFDFIFEIVLLPLAWIVATPFLLILSFFGKESYGTNLKNYYKKIKKFIWR